MRISIAVVATLAACGGSSKQQGVSNTGGGKPDDTIGAALADNAKLRADYTCACSKDKPSESYCSAPIVPDIREDNSMDPFGMKYVLVAPDRAQILIEYATSCFGKVADWEDARGLACLGRNPDGSPVGGLGGEAPENDGKKPASAGARPSCGTPPAYKLATVEPWWKQAKPCPDKMKLKTSPHPFRKDVPLAVWCVTVEEYDIEYAKGRITTFHMNGSVESDRDGSRRTDYYPNGQIQEDNKAGQVPPPDEHGIQPHSVINHVHYWPNGQISDKGDIVDNEMRGLWEGFRPDGTKDYSGVLKEYSDEPTWFDRQGKPIQKEKAKVPAGP